MKRITVLATVVTAAAFAATRVPRPKLGASVSDPVNISLKSGTKKVTSLKAGKYTIVVEDTASDRNFHLSGPGLNKTTSVAGRHVHVDGHVQGGQDYKYVCDPHASFMKGSFKVT
jgi:hypothetical protein